MRLAFFLPSPPLARRDRSVKTEHSLARRRHPVACRTHDVSCKNPAVFRRTRAYVRAHRRRGRRTARVVPFLRRTSFVPSSNHDKRASSGVRRARDVRSRRERPRETERAASDVPFRNVPSSAATVRPATLYCVTATPGTERACRPKGPRDERPPTARRLRVLRGIAGRFVYRVPSL